MTRIQPNFFSSAEAFLGSSYLDETKCLILDVQMPGMTGLEMQRRLASGNHCIPIIFISAHENQEVRNQAMRSGAVDFLPKPFSEESLLRAIRAALQFARWPHQHGCQIRNTCYPCE